MRDFGLNSAMVGGAIAGTSAAEYAKKKTESPLVSGQVEKLKECIYAPTRVKDGSRPLELRRKLVEEVCQAILEKGFMGL